MAEDEHGVWGDVAQFLQNYIWMGSARAFGSEAAGEARAIVEGERRKVRPLREHSATSDAAAAAPVEDVFAPRLPFSRGEFREDGVPFPADALAEGGIVKREFVRRFPVIALAGGAREETLAEAAEKGEVLRGPVAHSSPSFLARRCSRML